MGVSLPLIFPPSLPFLPHRVYLFDLRQPSAPLAVLGNHGRSVSYVRFVDGDRLVSASTDSALRLWDLQGVQGTQQHPSMVFKVW